MISIFVILNLIQVGLALQGKSVLIVQNKGGGHGSIGFAVAKSIKSSQPDCSIYLLQDKCNYKSVPFSSYGELKDLGVQVIDCPLSDEDSALKVASELKSMKFDYFVDNWSKTADNAKFCIDIAKVVKSEQYVFISSAGMYKSSYEAPLVEANPVKGNDARKIELEILNAGLIYTFLRPQYIYGSKCNKRYLDYFIGRLYRKLAVPLPMNGEQLVCLTHIEDVADLVQKVIGNPAAKNEVFNCGTNRYVTYKGLSKLINAELGNSDADLKHIYFNPDNFPNWDGKGVQEFPFRKETFITSPSKAIHALKWSPKHTLANGIVEEVAEYKRLGGFDEKWSNEEIKYDLEVLAAKGSL